MSHETIAHEIAAFSQRMMRYPMTPDVQRMVGRAVLDTCAAGVAGSREPAALRAFDYLRQLGQHAPGAGLNATLWGRGGAAPVEQAALWNGIAAHVLDYDDVTSPLRGHPSVAMLPALIALGEARGASGEELVRAYLTGFEVICAIARCMAVPHYAQGWHSTSTIGVLGAAVGCAQLLQLSAEQTVAAIGLAVAQAAGTRANFGYDAKSFQAGLANAAAVRAVLLAQAGFTASPQVLESAIGYMGLYGHGESLTQAASRLGEAPLELIRSGIEVKKYPLCYATHRAIDGMLDLRREHALEFASVEHIDVVTSKGALAPLVHHRPATGLEAKFSMEYALACALKDGDVRLTSFTDEAVRRADVQAFLPSVRCAETADGEVLPRWTTLSLTLRDGRKLFKRIDVLRGSASAPLSDDELRRKAKDCFEWVGLGANVCRAVHNALRVSEVAIADLVGSFTDQLASG